MKKIFFILFFTIGVIFPSYAATYSPWVFTGQEFGVFWGGQRLHCTYERRVYQDNGFSYIEESNLYLKDMTICPTTPKY